ncbi:MAG: HPr family phosphocarrier protein [Gammaproteobacteria bacterium]|nr:HPr family phosphocarrier protein [Gammaproteobacteria bacterium]
MQRKKIIIVNKLGLHARAAACFVKLAAEYQSQVVLEREHQKVNGKSIMGVMMLAASQGTELLLVTEGEDEDAAIEALILLVSNRFGEEV